MTVHGATDPRFGRRDEKLSACPNATVARAILPSLASTDLKGRPQAPRRDARKRRSRSLSNRTPVCPLIAAQTFCFSSPFPPSPPESFFPPSLRGGTRVVLMPRFCRFWSWGGGGKGWNRGRSKSRGAFFAPIGGEGGSLGFGACFCHSIRAREGEGRMCCGDDVSNGGGGVDTWSRIEQRVWLL